MSALGVQARIDLSFARSMSMDAPMTRFYWMHAKRLSDAAV